MAMEKCLRVLLQAIDHPRRTLIIVREMDHHHLVTTRQGLLLLRTLIIVREMDHHHLVTTRQGLLLRTIRERDCREILLTNSIFTIIKNDQKK
jgi:hypothetical protein